jgi:hypothetical protein
MKFRSLVVAVAGFVMAAAGYAGVLCTIADSANPLVSIDSSTLVRTTIGATGNSGEFGGMHYEPASDTLYWIPGRGNSNLCKSKHGPCRRSQTSGLNLPLPAKLLHQMELPEFASARAA